MILDRHDVLDLGSYRRITEDGELVELAPEVLRHVDVRREAMLDAIGAGMPAYGVTTGLGYLSSREIAAEDRLAWQRSMLLGRAVAIGPPLPVSVVRGAMLLRLAGFLEGSAAVSSDLCRFIADRLNDGFTPLVPSRPHGAAGEVTLLAPLFATFVGEGFVLEDGVQAPAAGALAARGVEPYRLGLKEGIALLNGAPFAAALTAPLIVRARTLLEHATVAAALATALVGASARPYSTRIGDPSERGIRKRLVELLGPEGFTDRPQAPISYRVVPQVHGVVAEELERAERRVERDLRAVTDSPLFLSAAGGEPEGFYPSGSFHSQALTSALDGLSIAFTQLANLAEKRLHRLLDARFSGGLPEQLAVEPGRHTGVSVLHKAVVALCADNRLHAMPVSLSVADTAAGQEDVQAFTPLAAEKLEHVLDNVELALAYELTAYSQARRLRNEELPPRLERVAAMLAEAVAKVVDDRPLAPDVERVLGLVRSGSLLRATASSSP